MELLKIWADFSLQLILVLQIALSLLADLSLRVGLFPQEDLLGDSKRSHALIGQAFSQILIQITV